MRKVLFVLFPVIIATTIAGAAPASASATKTCFTPDADGDGYAANDAAEEQKNLNGGVNCPSGYTRFKGDCAPGNAAVHPRRSEIANDDDDDCDGKTDEADPTVSASGNGNTTSGFKVTYRLVSGATVSDRANLRGHLQAAPLDGSASVSIVQQPVITQSRSTWRMPVTYFATFSFGGLHPTNVYKVTGTLRNTSGYVLGTLDDYHTTTDGTTQKSLARTRIVLQALKQLRDSDEGLVGHRGTSNVDGTRYTASTNEMWCSEFYMWSSRDELQGMSGRDTVSEMVSYFSAHGGYHTSTSAILSWADRGDYVAMDSDGDGDKNHSGMVLAVNGSSIWTIEGNVTNAVGVRLRSVGDYVKGLGHITYSMLP